MLFIYTLHYTELYIKWVPGFDKSHYDRTCNNKEGITVSDLFLLYYSIVRPHVISVNGSNVVYNNITFFSNNNKITTAEGITRIRDSFNVHNIHILNEHRHWEVCCI